MAAETQSPNFWTTLPGILTAIAGLITAITGLLIGLHQSGVIGDEANAGGASPSTVTSSRSASSGGTTLREGDALVGNWSGTARRDGSHRYQVRLQIESPCRLKEPCGTMSISSPACTSTATLWEIEPSNTYQFRLNQFTAESSPDCKPGAGEYFQLLDDGSLHYRTSYDDAEGELHR